MSRNTHKLMMNHQVFNDIQSISNYGFIGEVQESLIIPNDPSFVRLIEFFTDDDECIRYC